MNIDFILSQADNSPMYQQVMTRIKERVSVGDWPAGTRLPSIRELAVALKVSVITIKRAYQELEHDGTIVVQHGKGCFVAEPHGNYVEKQDEELEHHLVQAIKLADAMKIGPKELELRLREIREIGVKKRT